MNAPTIERHAPQDCHALSRPRGHRAVPALTDREHEIAALVREGLTNVEIGQTLYLSPRTVQSHVATAMEKLGVGSRTALAVHAIRLGLLPLFPGDAATRAPHRSHDCGRHAVTPGSSNE